MSKETYSQNVQRTLHPILYLHKLCGVVPFNLSTYKFQVIPFIMSTALIYTIIYMSLLRLDVNKEVNSSQAYIFKLIPILLSHGQVLFSALLLCVCHFKSITLNKRLNKIVLKFIKIDRIMDEQMDIRIDHRCMRLKYLAYVIVTCIIVNIINLYLFHKLDTNIQIKFLILFYLPNMYEKLYKVLYIVLIDMVKQRLQCLNAYLKNNLADEKIIYVREQNSEMEHYDGFHYLEKLNHIKLRNLHLRNILLAHSYLCEVGKMINQSCGLQILVSFIITFIVLVSMLFYLPVGILAHLSGKINLFFSFAHLYWFLLKMSLCIWFSKIITDCEKEVLLTSKHAYVLMIEDKVPTLTNQLEIFLQRISNHKMRLMLCGLFPLDNRFIYSIVGTATTYWIILIQFQLAMYEKE